MKKYLLLPIIILLANFNSNAQGNFAPIGATWHYEVWSDTYHNTFPVIIQSTDTITIGGQLCNKIEISGFGGIGAPLSNTYFVYESNDSVYYYLQNSGTFGLLYDFNAQPGDTVQLFTDDYTGGSGIDSFPMRVDSLNQITINGFTKNLINWSEAVIPCFYTIGGPVIEDIGSTYFLFPQIMLAYPHAGNLRCYEDSIVGLYQTGISPWCNAITSVNELPSSNLISVSPNPFSTSVNINSENLREDDYIISVYDLPGKLIYEAKKQFGTKTSIELSNLAKGIYVLKITGSNFAVTKKIIKE